MLEEMVLRLAGKAAVHWEMAIDHVSGWASRISRLLLVVLPPPIFYRRVLFNPRMHICSGPSGSRRP
jgi:hypothetical protein